LGRLTNVVVPCDLGKHSLKKLSHSLGRSLWRVRGFLLSSFPEFVWREREEREENRVRMVLTPEDFYAVHTHHLTSSQRRGTPKRAFIHFYTLLKEQWPELCWMEWRFFTSHFLISSPMFWRSKERISAFFHYLGQELSLLVEEYYKIRVKDVVRFGGRFILRGFENLFSALQFAFPEHSWKRWKFKPLPLGYWKDRRNVRMVFNSIGVEEKVLVPWEWIHVNLERVKSPTDVKKEWQLFDGYHVLKQFFPEFLWLKWRHSISSNSQMREMMDNAALELGIHDFKDWYGVKGDDFILRGYSSVLVDGSFLPSLKQAYSDVEWDVFKFSTPNDTLKVIKLHRDYYNWLFSRMETVVGDKISFPFRLWEKHFGDVSSFPDKNYRRIFERIIQYMGIECLEGGYELSLGDIDRKGGISLVHLLSVLPKKNLMVPFTFLTLFPEITWSNWRFSGLLIEASISEVSLQRIFLDWIISRIQSREENIVKKRLQEWSFSFVELNEFYYNMRGHFLRDKLGIEEETDWCRISHDQIKGLIGKGEWESGSYVAYCQLLHNQEKRVSQHWLRVSVKAILPTHFSIERLF